MEQFALRLFNKKKKNHCTQEVKLFMFDGSINLFYFRNFVSECLFAFYVPIKVEERSCEENVGLYKVSQLRVIYLQQKPLSSLKMLECVFLGGEMWNCKIIKRNKLNIFSGTNFPIKCKTILSAHEANSKPVFWYTVND